AAAGQQQFPVVRFHRAALRDSVRVSGEDRNQQRVVSLFPALPLSTALARGCSRSQELALDAIDSHHRAHLEIHLTQTRWGEIGRRGLFKQIEPMKQIARPDLSGLSLSFVFEKLRSDDVALADQRRDDASLFADAARLRLDQHARLARVQWK